MDNFGRLFHQAMRNDPLHVTMKNKKGYSNDSNVYPLLPRYASPRDVQSYVKRLTAFHSELAGEEIQIQQRNTLIADRKYSDFLQNMIYAPWAVDKISNLKIDALGKYITIHSHLREIESNTPIGSFLLSEPESYKKARESYQTILNILFTQIEIWKIIPDDIP